MPASTSDLLLRYLISGSIPSPRFTASQALQPMRSKQRRRVRDILPVLNAWIQDGRLRGVGQPKLDDGVFCWTRFEVTAQLVREAAELCAGFAEHNHLRGPDAAAPRS